MSIIFIKALILHLFSTAIITISGYFFLFYIQKNLLSINKYLTASLSYFSGISLFYTLYRVTDILISNAYLALLISSLFLISFIFINVIINKDLFIWLNFKKNVFTKNFFIYILISLVLSAWIFLYWIKPNSIILGPYSFFGSLHGSKYSNIAKYITSYNKIPLLNQNYGQSLLCTIQLFVNNNASLLSLFFWLTISIHFLIIATYGLLRSFGMSIINSKISTILILWGNTALMISPILIIDSGSPFFFNGYTDSICSIGSLIIFLFWYFKNHEILFVDINWRSVVLLFILFFSWNIFAPQNIVISVSILVFTIFIYILKRNLKIKRSLFYLFIILCFILTGSKTGGMLMSKKDVKDLPIPGVMSLNKAGMKIGILPHLPYCFYNGFDWEQTSGSLGTTDQIKTSYEKYKLKKSISSISELFFRVLWLFEINFWIMIKILGIPIIGLIGMYIIIIKKEKNIQFYPLFINTTLIFLIGVVISFVFRISDYKWELTRFLIPGIYFSMVNFCIFLFRTNYLKNIFLKFVIFTFLLLPTITFSMISIYNNLTDTKLFNIAIERILQY